jgi:electron transport complex protein RnfC
VLGGRELFLLGRILRTGRPLTILPLTLGSSNYFIPLGARIIDLLTFANLMPGLGDTVIKGGLIRGRSLSRLERGLDQTTAALHLVRGAGATTYNPCRECGQCTRACPSGLPIARLAGGNPNEWPDRMKWPELDNCLICGACALACPSRRPLLSLARLAQAAAETKPPSQ